MTTTAAGQKQGHIKELKSTDRAIGVGMTKGGLKRDAAFWSQFDDYLSLHRKNVAGASVEKVTYVFTSPAGARQNRAAMEQMFKLASRKKVPLAIEFFDAAGRRHIIDKRADIAAKLEAAFGGTP